MLSESGKVVGHSRDNLEISITSSGACSSCSGKNICGHRLLNSWYSRNSDSLDVDIKELETNTGNVQWQVGDEIFISMTESKMLQLSLLFYMLPLMLMGISMLVLDYLNTPEWGVIILSIILLPASFYMIRKILLPKERQLRWGKDLIISNKIL